MKSSPLHRPSLYPRWPSFVMLALTSLFVIGLGFAQIAKRQPKNKGPRALGLLELAANGRAHLVPVTIMIDGRFYDASVYKADPVPMALEPGTVYEALKTGVSQGLFTVGGSLQSENQGWIGDGKWQTNAEIQAEKDKEKARREKLAQKAPPPETEIGGPPKLKREGEAKPGATPPVQSPPPQNTSPSSGPPAKSETSQSSSSSSSIEAPDRPVLRRQAPSETTHEQTKAAEPEPLKGALQFIPAVSDANGPDPRPYAYQMKPEEEQAFLKKMLVIAGDEVRARAVPPSKEKTTKAKPAPPQFQNVQLRVFDLSNNNEPVLVLTADGKMPGSANDLTYMVAVVAREDIYAEMHKVFASTTDNQHLDVSSKYELIDAVDADGDGAGELLFRMTSDGGSAYGVYRVIGDRLWPLFEGKPGA